MEIISVVGMIIGIIVLCLLVMKGVNPFVVVACATLIVCLTGGIGPYAGFKDMYMTGFSGFVKSNFIIFVAGAFMAKVYESTMAAKAIARLIVRRLGPQAAVFAIPIATGVMSYAGVSGFVVVFAVFPIALEIFRSADVPRKMIPGAIIFGACTFSCTGPGAPQVPAVVLVNALGTDLMASPVVGFICTGVILVVGMLIFMLEIKKAKKNGEHFVAKDTDVFEDDADLPNGWVALAPLIVTVIAINVKIGGHALIPVEFGLIIGAFAAYFIMRRYDHTGVRLVDQIGESIKNAITAITNTAAVVGFGSVVQAAIGFPLVVKAISNIPGPTMVAVALATTILAGVCGSASGGLGIAAPILQPIFSARGVTDSALHRMMLISSSALDTLPHNGFAVTVIQGVCRETHKDAYPLVFKLTVFTPAVATVVAIILYTVFPGLM